MEIYQKDLEIDKNNLEVECLKFSSTYDKYSSELEELKYQKDVMQTQYELLTKQVELEIRNISFPNPQYPKIQKLTENIVSAIVTIDVKVQKKQEELIEIKKKINILSSFITSLNFKSSKLKLLVSLYINNYYANNIDSVRNNLK